MQDEYNALFDRDETPFDESQGSVAELDVQLDPLGVRVDRIESTLDRLDARLKPVGADGSRMDDFLHGVDAGGMAILVYVMRPC